ncbi:uncharacterized protein LOC133779657 [Humulus lupulus]|uniref:uncharacterized protein LOC133779657 n=1 Tax=Humulus lupulus TaxID=3486 RepID=UPI002B411860|nr:uncharacterized protein LOC133779657 [Humulus lupulus]
MAKVLGVEAIDFSDGQKPGNKETGTPSPLLMIQENEDLVLSPEETLAILQRQDDIKQDFSNFLSASHRCAREISKGKCPTPPVLRSGSVVQNLSAKFGNSEKTSEGKQGIKIELEDIEKEVHFWNSSLVCYVLGANPPLSVLEGFARRVWRTRGVDKKENVCKVPTWIQLTDLDLKYWGERSLFKIVSQLGKPLMVDPITKNREKLNFARLLIEVSINRDFPKLIFLENELAFNVSISVHYEWVLAYCSHCKGMGHKAIDYHRKEGKKQEWVVKTGEPKAAGKEQRKQLVVDDEGFQVVLKGGKHKNKGSNIVTVTSNSFQALEKEKGECSKDQMEEAISGGGGVGLIGLLETRVKAHELGALYLHMFLGWCFTSNNAWNNGGHIVVAWNPTMFSVSIIKFSSQLIHLLVRPFDKGDGFYVSFVYGFNEEEGRVELWKELPECVTQDPWLALGDFNDILNKEERIGVKVKYNKSVAFRQCIERCNLEDVKFTGSFYTWNNKQQGNDRIYSKVDRVMENQRWLDWYTAAEVTFSNEGMFDHCPAMLTVYSDVGKGKKPFRYFKMWSTAPGFFEQVKQNWSEPVYGTPMFRVVTKLKRLKALLNDLNKKGFNELHSAHIKALQDLKEC